MFSIGIQQHGVEKGLSRAAELLCRQSILEDVASSTGCIGLRLLLVDCPRKVVGLSGISAEANRQNHHNVFKCSLPSS